ncbi:hypothetical protein [Aromatoleum bremense]|uniref:Uncharacterized protein n=1 Tax=Aromatoleum bremense TaxID=76115 RepID=A0ABX1NSN6_9RHOO|nr:hypothetical protein [Aromatoleum bremense]NMG14907.1 hypothetical protein [Aromatoleum bremense]QTQ32389.1 Uncharacterized protein pbN1_23990 [Aromatoleum bremense]
MSLFGLFTSAPEKALARKLAEHLAKNIPPKLMDKGRQVLSANRVSRLLEQAFETAKEHQLQTGMGFMKRAILANSFKWELQAKGYPKDFINVATEGLVVELSKARQSRNAK